MKGFVTGVLLGSAAGIAAGALLVPADRRQVRRRVAYLLDHWASEAVAFATGFGKPKLESPARSSGAALIADAREQAARILSDADALMNRSSL